MSEQIEHGCVCKAGGGRDGLCAALGWGLSGEYPATAAAPVGGS